MMKSRITRRLCTFIVFKMVLITFALAQQTIQVPANAPTIQSAIDAASNGDTIMVSPGVYNENIDFKGKSIVLTSKAQSFSDAVVAATVINGSSDGPVITFQTNEPSSAILNGFTIQNGHASQTSGKTGGGIFISSSSPQVTNNIIASNLGCGIHVVNTASPLLQGNDIKQNTYPTTGEDTLCTSNYGGAGSGTGIAIDQAGTVQVIGNTIEENNLNETDTGAACGAGVRINSGTEVLLQDNIIRNNRAICNPGIDEDEFFPTTKLVMIQNLVYGNTSDNGPFPIEVYLSGTTSAPYPSVTEINNTVYGGGEELLLNFASSTISNNIFVNTFGPDAEDPAYSAGLFCIGAQAQTAPIAINNNDIFNTGTPQTGGCNLGPANLTVDPQFVDSAIGNFHTQPTSPIVAAGDVDAPLIPTADLDGKARTVCNTIDMGTYEIRPHPPIVLTASPNPTPGQSTVTLVATVKGNCNVPTGTVSFLDGASTLGSAVIKSNGVATFSTSFLIVGTHTLTATYAGDFNFENSTSNLVTEVITGPSTTTTLNSAMPNPAYPLQPITLAASVNSSYTIPTGSITFATGSNALATVPVNTNGMATATVSTLHAGTYAITASYDGSTEYGASTSKPITEVVIASNTQTTLTVTPNPAASGQTVVLSAHVSATQGGVNGTGSVSFSDGGSLLGAAPVGSNGIASLGISTLQTGTHSISASYSGSSDLGPSTSPSVIVVISGVPTITSLSSSSNPSSFGQSVTFTATSLTSSSAAVPAGTIVFSDGTASLGSSPLVNGIASFTTSSLAIGAHQLTATLAPGTNYGGSTSEVLTQVVNDFGITVSVSPASVSIPSGDYEKVSVTVAPTGGFTGAVSLSCSGLPAHSQCGFSSSTTKPLSNGAQTVQLIVDTSDVLGYGQEIASSPRGVIGSTQRGAQRLALILLPPFWLFSTSARLAGRQRKIRSWLALVAIGAVCLLLSACSGKLPGATPPGNYIITIIAQNGSGTSALSATTTISLQVTK
jgi:parallel beta-helix repeat protein